MTESDNRLFLIDGKLIDDLYVEAMVLADEARAYLEKGATLERDLLEPVDRVHFSCEALKVTTRLMQVIAWLLSRRAYLRGEIELAESRSEKFRLGDAAPTDAGTTRIFPADMRVLITASESLYMRAQRLEEQLVDRPLADMRGGSSPARDLMQMLRSAF
jgi:regulator of CtrA degradation